MMKVEDKELYTLNEFLALAGISRAAYYQRLRRRTVPKRFVLRFPSKDGGPGHPFVLIPRDEADAWLKANPRSETTSQRQSRTAKAYWRHYRETVAAMGRG